MPGEEGPFAYGGLQVGIKDGLILLGLGFLIFALCWPLLSVDSTSQAALAPGDLTLYYYPLIAYTVERLQEGRFPLWNPYVLGGFPHLAELQTQALYPLTWLAALICWEESLSYRAFAGLVIAHLILAAWGAYGFFRWLMRDRAAGAFGAVAWGVSGYITGYPIQAPPILGAATWLPWLLWTAGRALTGQRFWRRNGVAAAFLWAMVFLAGFPQKALYVYGIALAFGVACVLSQPVQQRRRAWKTGILIVGCGTLMASVQLLPSAELAAFAERLEWPFHYQATSFEVWDLLGILWPHLANWSPLYVGVPVLLAGLLLEKQDPRGPRSAALWTGIGFAGILLSLGKESGFFPALVHLFPILGVFRNQERAALIVAWALVVLGTLGWKGAVYPARRRGVGIALGILGAILAGFFLWVQAQPVSEWPRLHRWLSYALWPWGIGGLAWLLLGRWPRTRWALIGLLALDLGSVAWRTAIQTHWVWAPPESLVRPPISPEQIPERAKGHRIDTRGHLTGGWPALVGLEDLHGVVGLVGRFLVPFREQVPGERVWALMGVGCYVWREDEPPIPFPSERVASLPGHNHPLHFECLQEPFPRYRLVYESIAFDDETAIRALRDGQFDPLRVVILDRPWSVEPSVSLPLSPTIRVLFWSPEDVQLQVQTPRSGFLVVGDPWYPGWYARVDGQPAPVLRAYTALRAVPLSAGEHVVWLYYRPLSFRLGGILSLLSLGVLFIWAFWPRLRFWFLRRC
ncbi:MAG: YfhO family protein [Anaerolineae bacterium]|nr:YfhO family protein [Anaerolineae bacterium]MDW7992347.1 YfhO family protein [Anaerolineae bacterium]